MADRISNMRALLRSELEAAGSKKDWAMITSQIGMFAYTGMTEAMCDELMAKCVLFHSIYASIHPPIHPSIYLFHVCKGLGNDHLANRHVRVRGHDGSHV